MQFRVRQIIQIFVESDDRRKHLCFSCLSLPAANHGPAAPLSLDKTRAFALPLPPPTSAPRAASPTEREGFESHRSLLL